MNSSRQEQVGHLMADLDSEDLKGSKISLDREEEVDKLGLVIYSRNLRSSLEAVVAKEVVKDKGNLKLRLKEKTLCLHWKLILWKLLMEVKRLLPFQELTYVALARAKRASLAHLHQCVMAVADLVLRQLGRGHLLCSKCVGRVKEWDR